MGEINRQLADEAERDTAEVLHEAPVLVVTVHRDAEPSLLGRLVSEFLIGPAAAQTEAAARTDETTLTLEPGQGSEIKLVMKKGATVEFSWTVAGGVVNFDLHGDEGQMFKSYEKGRAFKEDEGILEAAFDGSHGWFWRNRGSSDVTVTLRTRDRKSTRLNSSH